LGPISKRLRYLCCKQIFKFCGVNVNIERNASFGKGFDLEIGDNSGIGIKCTVPSDIKIGKHVMMAPNCYILSTNHDVSRTDIPMWIQGTLERKLTIINDDVWIGRQVLFTPGRIVQEGTIVAAGSVLTKDFPAFSIVGGNPAKLIKMRK
jgi:maltose O-acetyltransferase